ncbi:tyrosine-type recombinase/integrase [Nocardia tengchongensis]|uniref:tyrosine-type recombinase/integrase n=1 Tax=Nocardia tengchongensis TaxID=2055889 RepID=UPI0036BCD738
MPEHMRSAILLGAFTGLRLAEACGLDRHRDVDYIDGIVHPRRQWPAKPLKSPGSEVPIPIPRVMATMLLESVKRWPGQHVLADDFGNPVTPWQIQRALSDIRPKIAGLPEEFGFQDLRHYYASVLIAHGANIKVVQARMRHANAKTTLDTYGHLWPDTDESTPPGFSRPFADRVVTEQSKAIPRRTERGD